MSEPKIATPPEATECEHTHQHLVCESLTVKPPGCEASVTIMGGKGATGVWVQSGKGSECVGLIVQDGVGPFLAIYDEKAQGVPTAITQDGIQVHGLRDAVTISFADLIAAVRQVVQPKPA